PCGSWGPSYGDSSYSSRSASMSGSRSETAADRRSRFRLPVRKIYTQLFSPSSVTYSPPFFKCFLRLDVTPDAVRLRCFAATGNRDQEMDPPVEDEITIPLS
ncbi:metallophosphoesterase, partial [Streptomyces sp. NPDC058469]